LEKLLSTSAETNSTKLECLQSKILLTYIKFILFNLFIILCPFSEKKVEETLKNKVLFALMVIND